MARSQAGWSVFPLPYAHDSTTVNGAVQVVHCSKKSHWGWPVVPVLLGRSCGGIPYSCGEWLRRRSHAPRHGAIGARFGPRHNLRGQTVFLHQEAPNSPISHLRSFPGTPARQPKSAPAVWVSAIAEFASTPREADIRAHWLAPARPGIALRMGTPVRASEKIQRVEIPCALLPCSCHS